MFILGIETATAACSVALLSYDTLISEMRIVRKNIHAEKLFGCIQKILNLGDVEIKDVNGIAVSIGPGSFTGLRIGLSAAKGLAYSTGAKIIAVSTLHAIAEHVSYGCENICALIGSRKDEFYMAQYSRQGGAISEVLAPSIIGANDLVEKIPEGSVLVGPALLNIDEALLAKLQEKCVVSDSSMNLPDAFSVARLASERFQEGQHDDPNSLEPFYLQDFIAGKPKNRNVQLP